MKKGINQVRARVEITVDLEKAAALGYLDLASRLVDQFRGQGEDWQRDLAAEPLLREFMKITVETGLAPDQAA